ncbi:binding partner of ACD11 1-like [Setaria italica]|nr:binding partner of ACD11 1-like [Setaria italica]
MGRRPPSPVARDDDPRSSVLSRLVSPEASPGALGALPAAPSSPRPVCDRRPAVAASVPSMCGDVAVNITPVEDYELPPEAYSNTKHGLSSPRTPTGAAVRKAEEVVSTMLARGFVRSKDALRRAQSFDEWHQQLLSSATSRVASLDRRLRLSDKFSLGTAVARGTARGVNKRFNVTERSWGTLAAAGEVVAGSPYASRGVTWVSAAVGAVARAASDVGAMTVEKVARAEGEGTAADGAGSGGAR